MFKTSFDVINGVALIGTLDVAGTTVSIKYKNGKRDLYNINDIVSVEIVQAEEIDTGNSVTGGVLGGLLLGPFGALAGASVGRLTRKCKFLISMSDGETIACEGMHKIFDYFYAYLKVSGVKL